MKQWSVIVAFLAASVSLTRAAFAQVGSITTTAPITASVSSLWSTPQVAADAGVAATLTVLISSGGTQTIASLLDNRVNAFPTPVQINTSWNLSNLISTIDLVAYFTTPTAALVNGSNTLPSSRMLGRVTTGRPTAFTAFSQNPVGGVGTPGGSLHLFRQVVLWPFNVIGQRTDNLDLQLDLRGIPSLPNGTYAGTLNIRAVAY
ncbi:MAG: hypothetical protein U0132_16190 [Gemmatimonadaceae bacterium]